MDVNDLLIPILTLAIALLLPLIKRLTARKTGAMLVDAVNRGDAEALEKLLARGAPADATNDLLGRTPLIIATMNGHVVLVRILLARGANVNISDMEGWTALRYARGFGYTDITQLLLAAGARE
jgi:ankyrin repeat protein